MAGSARSVFTRVLPWAALALMSVAFLLQVKARQKAQGDAVKAKDELRAYETLRLASGTRPPPARVPPPPVPARADEVGPLRKQLEAAHAELAAVRAARQGAIDKAERTEALRATEAARADALERAQTAQAADAEEQVANLQAELEDAKVELARRESPVARWLALAEGGGPHALAVIRAETPRATADDVQELAARWKMKPPDGGALEVALVLEHMPATSASGLLAADLYLSCQVQSLATRVLQHLGAHILQARAVARVLAAGSNEAREDLVSHAAAGERGWDEAARARVAAALGGLLESDDDDPWTLEIAIRAFAQLDLAGHGGKLLPFLTHLVPEVRIAAVYALLATSDKQSALRTLHPTVAGLLDDEAFDVRMAGLFLAQELVGEKRSLAFGSSDAAIAKEIARLKQKLSALARE